MSIKCGQMVTYRNAKQINTGATAFMMGATGQEAILCGPESQYLINSADCRSNRPIIKINQGGRYRIEGPLKEIKALCQKKYDQRFERGTVNDQSLQLVVRVSELSKKFSEHFAELAGGFGGSSIPFLYEALTAGAAAGETMKVALTFYLSYGGDAGQKLGAWKMLTKGDKGQANRDPVFALGKESNMAAVGAALIGYNK